MAQVLVRLLGYVDDTQDPVLDPVLDADRIARIAAIQTKLSAIDEAIQQGTIDSMALNVGELRVDFLKNIRMLKAEGSRLLNLLAQELTSHNGYQGNLYVVWYDSYIQKYHPKNIRSKNAGWSNKNSITSYW